MKKFIFPAFYQLKAEPFDLPLLLNLHRLNIFLVRGGKLDKTSRDNWRKILCFKFM